MKDNWFYRKSSIRTLWRGAIVILCMIIIVEAFIHLPPHFTIEKLFAFHALYGFLACVAMVLFAKLLGFLIRRKDDYYDM